MPWMPSASGYRASAAGPYSGVNRPTSSRDCGSGEKTLPRKLKITRAVEEMDTADSVRNS